MSFFKIQAPIPPVKTFTTFGAEAKMLLIDNPSTLPALYDSNGFDISGNPIGRSKWVGLPIETFYAMFFRVRTWRMSVTGFSATVLAKFEYTSGDPYEQVSELSLGSMDGSPTGWPEDPEHMMVVRLGKGSAVSDFQTGGGTYSQIFPNGSHVFNIRTELNTSIAIGYGLHGWMNSTGTVLNFVYFHKESGKVYFPVGFQIRSKAIAEVYDQIIDGSGDPVDYGASGYAYDHLSFNTSSGGTDVNGTINIMGEPVAITLKHYGSGPSYVYGSSIGDVLLTVSAGISSGFSITFEPDTYFAHDPGDGKGPCYSTSTGAQLRRDLFRIANATLS